MKITVEEARPDHLPPILDDIRPEDYREWYAGTGNPNFEENLRGVFEDGGAAWAAVGEDGKALILWGVDDLDLGYTGNVWMFATSTAERHAISLHRALKGEVDKLTRLYSRLEAWSDSRNTKHHTWLEWLGFTFQREEFLQPLGLPFKLYTIRRP